MSARSASRAFALLTLSGLTGAGVSTFVLSFFTCALVTALVLTGFSGARVFTAGVLTAAAFFGATLLALAVAAVFFAGAAAFFAGTAVLAAVFFAAGFTVFATALVAVLVADLAGAFALLAAAVRETDLVAVFLAATLVTVFDLATVALAAAARLGAAFAFATGRAVFATGLAAALLLAIGFALLFSLAIDRSPKSGAWNKRKGRKKVRDYSTSGGVTGRGDKACRCRSAAAQVDEFALLFFGCDAGFDFGPEFQRPRSPYASLHFGDRMVEDDGNVVRIGRTAEVFALHGAQHRAVFRVAEVIDQRRRVPFRAAVMLHQLDQRRDGAPFGRSQINPFDSHLPRKFRLHLDTAQ